MFWVLQYGFTTILVFYAGADTLGNASCIMHHGKLSCCSKSLIRARIMRYMYNCKTYPESPSLWIPAHVAEMLPVMLLLVMLVLVMLLVFDLTDVCLGWTGGGGPRSFPSLVLVGISGFGACDWQRSKSFFSLDISLSFSLTISLRIATLSLWVLHTTLSPYQKKGYWFKHKTTPFWSSFFPHSLNHKWFASF